MIRKTLTCALISLLIVLTQTVNAADPLPRVTLQTNKGSITLELYADRAPLTVKNFLDYVNSGQYENTIFHRVIKDFMIQGGGFDTSLKKKPTGAPIKNEADNGVANTRGTIAMARTGDPHSATAQFFINTVDNHYLNHRRKTTQGWGYTVFGHVVTGMDTVDRIGRAPTRRSGQLTDLPRDTVIIEKAVVETPIADEKQN